MSLRNIFFLFLLMFLGKGYAQTSDSLIVKELRSEGVSFSKNNTVTLLLTGQEKFDDLFLAIKQAKSSIHLEYFNFRNDSIANQLFNLLADKVKEGVEVRALFDAFGNMSNNKPLRKKELDNLRERGIEIYEFDPIRFPWINHVFARDHRKIVVIDGSIAYTGGMNVADYYINGTKVVGEWHDMHFRIEGDDVNTLQKIFIKTLNNVTKQQLSGAKYYRGDRPNTTFVDLKRPAVDSLNNMMVGIINREPRTSNAIIRKFYTTAIDVAKDSIQIINPYFTLNRAIKKAIKRAVKRGVKVDIMLSVRSDIPLTPDCGFYNAHQLMKRGCNIWMYMPGFHHTKVIMVDGLFCTVGSANLNSRSLNFDYEANAVIVNKEVTQELCNLFNAEKKESFLLTPKKWNEMRTPWKKFVGWFAHLLAPVL